LRRFPMFWMMFDIVEFREHPIVNERCFVLTMTSERVCGGSSVLAMGKYNSDVLIVVHGAQVK